LEKFDSQKTGYRESMVRNKRVIGKNVLHSYLYPKCTTGLSFFILALSWLV